MTESRSVLRREAAQRGDPAPQFGSFPPTRIAIDIHDVCADYIGEMIRRIGWPTQLTGRLREFWPDYDWEEHYRSVNQEFLESLPPIADARHTLWSWEIGAASGEGIEAVYVTATSDGMRQSILKWLSKNHFPPLPLFMTGGIEEKCKWFVERSGVYDFLIEDHQDVLVAAAPHVRQVLIFNAPWNKDVDIPNGIRISNWKDIRKVIGGYY